MVHTDTKSYWDPVKPRINIYGFTDTTYSSPLYTYNGFTDVGTSDRPIALSFESQTTTAGTFSLEIDDSADSLDPDMFTRGNRVVIECSKDNSTWQTAFKGLVRSAKQKIFAQNNRTLTLEGYSYLIRLSERIMSTRKQSKLLVSGQFDRTDSAMFTDNLINDLLTNDIHYLNSVDDTQLYNIFKTANITSSPIDDWIPRVDVALDTVSDGINSVLEFSNSLLSIDFSNDQLVLFNPDRVPNTGGAGVFLLTDAMNQSADDASYTMYPTADYTYQLSYDYPDAGNRLIGSIGTVKCPQIVVPGTPGSGGLDTTALFNFTNMFSFNGNVGFGGAFFPTGSPVKRVRIGCQVEGNPTGANKNQFQAYIINGLTGQYTPWFYLYPESVTTGYGDPAGTMPSATSGTLGAKFVMTTQSTTQLNLTNYTVEHYLDVWPMGSTVMDTNNNYRWGWNGTGNYATFNSSGQQTGNGSTSQLLMDIFAGSGTPTTPTGGTPDTVIPPCGGLPESADADAMLSIASDANAAKRIGMVEQTVTNIPIHVKKFQSMQEYMFNKLYVVARPRFSFEYPSVTVPTIMPKAADLCCHVSKKAQVGRTRTGVQTGVISAVSYQFSQDSDSVLGLRKLSIATTGILRGSY